ncbi:glycoside hydrolase family 2 TIM barrel-domain containing protein [Catenovulum agarivorans]|uniref:glycoside hydrolase family 2 TIM barrel-domain containing protein n=1 Tax=Catenovulum agarivorans TaxID=1172192 RepID=UPI0002F6CF14|nr:glycoside hydrolase family 2 TIM barrel-domain containing protein [Catenovulum agarivorans]
MRKLLVPCAVMLALAGCTQSSTQSDAVAEQIVTDNIIGEISLNQAWSFQRTQGKSKIAAPESADWQQVNLPHTPKLEPLVVNDQWQGIAFYKKTLDLSNIKAGKSVYLRFEGAMKVADVWLNDEYLGQHVGGYLPFTFDLTKYAGKKNLNLLVRLDNQDNWLTGPKPLHLLDFNTYGGLYRDVKLIVKNALHISDEMQVNEVASGGLFITTPVVSEARAEVQVKTHVINANKNPAAFSVKQTLWFDGQVVASKVDQVDLAAEQAQQFSQSIAVTEPKLWHPHHPHLYKLVTEVVQNDQVVDSQTNQIGIREFKFDDKHQLLINGKPFFLRGVNRHQEYPHVGYATSPEADYRDAYLIKSAGFDYVRLSHYPHSKAFMQAADELGLLLIDAILGWQYYSPFPEFKEQIYQTCTDLLRRDRNHPSVLAWECSLNESWMPADFIKGLDDIVDAEYPGALSAGWQKEYDIYLQARQHRLEHYDEPKQPYNVSEYGDWEYYAQNAGLNQDAWGDLKAEERTSRQLITAGEKRLLQQATNIQEAHNDNLSTPAHADGFWVMFDYNRGYADDLESSGVASIYRMPKYSYYFYQSQRSPEVKSDAYESGPMVYIASDWNELSDPNVRVFTNAERVDIHLNGKLVKSQKPKKEALSSNLKHPPMHFNLKKFVAGELVAKAYIGNELVAEHKVVTPGKATAIEMSVAELGKPVAANDVIFVRAQLVDANGNPTYDNGVTVNFVVPDGLVVTNPHSILTEKGVATAVVKVGEQFAGKVISASTESGFKAQVSL